MRLAKPVHGTQAGMLCGASTWLHGPATTGGPRAGTCASLLVQRLSDGTSAYETSGYLTAAAFWRVTRPAVSSAAVDAGASVGAAACARKRAPSTTDAT